MRDISAIPIRRFCWSLLTVLAVALAALPAGAQVLYGSLVGSVQDESGAVVPGAAVTLTNKGTGQVLEATTDTEGNYSINNILPGTYDVKVTKQGFTTYAETGLNISANNVTRADVNMKVGNVTDTVSVAADATALQTESATVKSELSSREIQALPLAAYRNYQSLLNLVPGTTPAAFQNANTDTPERSLTTNVNGTARNNNNTRLDGAASVNIWLPHHSAYVPPSESVQEVNVSTNNFDAEQGLAGGAAIQVITKSGTNELHGSAFAYHDNHVFQARNFFQQTQLGRNKPKLLRNIDGGTIGGPIVRDKLFFFGSYEAMLERVIRQGIFSVPTAARRNGDFSNVPKATAIFNPFTGNLDGTGRTQFANNIITPNLINPISKQVLALVPLPNLPGEVNNYFNSAPQEFDRHNFDVKVNWNRNERHQIFTKFSHMKALVTGQYQLGAAGGACLCDGGSGSGDTKSYVGSVGHTWTLGSGFIVDGNFAVTQRTQVVLPPDYGQNIGLDVLKIPGTNGPDPRQSGLPQFNLSTFTSYGNQNTWAPLNRDERSYTFAQNVTKLLGNHDFRFGADIVRHELNHWQPEIGAGPRGRFNFTGNETALKGAPTGTPGPNEYNSFAAFLLGTPQTVEKSIQYELMTTREWQYGFYARDRWQVGRNLTLTLGLRYELFPIMVRADRGIEVLDLNSPVQLTNGTPNGFMQVLLGGRGGNPETLNVSSRKTMFAPRLGFAWRVNDDTVVRSGYGITYDPMPFGRPLRGFYPLTIAQQFVADYAGADPNLTFSPYGALSGGALVPGLNVGIRSFGGPDLNQARVNLPGTVQMRSPYDRQLNRGYIQSWNLFVERKLIGDTKIEVGYVGTQTTNQLADLELNASEPGQAAQAPLRAKYGRTASTLMWDGWLSSNYHALQVAVNRRYSKGLFVKAAYTWSKAINMTDDTGWAGLTFNSPSAISKNRARAGYDIPHNLQIGAAYELPFGKGRKWMSDGAGATIFGGWAINPIFSAVSGRPFTVTAANNTLQALNSGTQTPDLVGDIKRLDYEPLLAYAPGARTPMYDPSAFRLVTGSPRFGSSGRNVLRGPGFINLDLSLIRDFRITERVTAGLRVDGFNVTNTPHFNNPAANLSGANFLVITSARDDQRLFRFGLRIGF
jgi:hypothetical protein